MGSVTSRCHAKRWIVLGSHRMNHRTSNLLDDSRLQLVGVPAINRTLELNNHHGHNTMGRVNQEKMLLNILTKNFSSHTLDHIRAIIRIHPLITDTQTIPLDW